MNLKRELKGYNGICPLTPAKAIDESQKRIERVEELEGSRLFFQFWWISKENWKELAGKKPGKLGPIQEDESQKRIESY